MAWGNTDNTKPEHTDAEEKDEADAEGDHGSDESNSSPDEDGSDLDDYKDSPSSFHDAQRYSPEAISWALDELGHAKYAKYYEYGKDRSSQDIQQMANENRTWKIKLRNLNYTNHGDVGHLFLVIHFGWNFKLVSKYVRVKDSVPKGAKLANRKASTSKRNEKKRSKAKRTWVSDGTKGHSVVTKVHMNSDKGETFQFELDTIHEFEWQASYFDLFDKKLRVEVWDWNEFLPNTFLACHQAVLKDVASGELNYDWELKRHQRGHGRFGEVTVGRLRCQCVVQEVLPYQLKLTNWTLGLNPKLESSADQHDVQLLPYAQFRLVQQSGLSLGGDSATSRATVVRTQGGRAVSCDLQGMPVLRFCGTRLELEGRLLQVEVFNKGWFKNRLFSRRLGLARIPLKAVVQNGHLGADIMPAARGRLGRWFADPKLVPDGAGTAWAGLGEVAGNLDAECLDAPLWREFAQFGELQPPELLDFPPYNQSYLAVRVVSARGLVAVDSSGYSDPYVTVEWAGVRQSTAVVEESLNPSFDETLYFHIRPSLESQRVHRQDLVAHPAVVLTVWDHNAAGASDLLGSCTLYLHEITGCPREFRFTGPKPRRVPVQRRTRARLGGPSRLRTTSILTRMLRVDRRLEGLAPGVDSFLRLEAFFRTPDGDLHEPPAPGQQRQSASQPSPMLLPNLRAIAAQRRVVCFCYPGRTEAACNAGGGRCEALELFYSVVRSPGPGQWSPAAWKRLEALEKAMKLRDLCAENQFGHVHFLSSYLQPLAPPRAMLDRREVDKMAIISSQKPNSSFTAARMVRAIEFVDLESDKRNVTRMHRDSWLSPDFFLSMRKGDVKAHALLLCNALLGLMTDAYVCLGYIAAPAGVACEGPAEPRGSRNAKEGALLPYVWVMTRESDSSACGLLFADRSTHGGAVKFWDVTRGTYYPPLPNRWRSRDDADNLKRARGDDFRHEVDRGKVDKARNPAQDAANGDDPEDLGEPEAWVVHGEREELSEDDLLQWGLQGLDELDDAFAAPRPAPLAQPGAQGDPVEPWAPAAAEPAPAKPEQLGLREKLVQGPAEEGSDYDAAHEARKRRGYISRYNACVASKRRAALGGGAAAHRTNPFACLVAVFNHRNVWVNVQEDSDPNCMTFDLEDGAAGGWLPVVGPERTVRPHYAARSLEAMITKEAAAEIQARSLHEVQSGIEVHRGVRNLETRWGEGQMGALVAQVLEAKAHLEGVDKVWENGWDPKAKKWMPLSEVFSGPEGAEELEQGAGYSGAERLKQYRRHMQLLAGCCPAGFEFRLEVARANTGDPKEVKRRLLDPTGSKAVANAKGLGRVFDENHGGREMFAVGVYVERMYHKLTSVYVGVLVVYPKSTQEGGKSKEDVMKN